VSQVIVTQDNLSERREASRKQERMIDTDSGVKKWQLGDIVKGDPGFRKFLLVALSPLFAFWGILMIGVSFALGLFSFIMRVLGSLIPR
jgi:hypothetical protein